MRKKETHGKQNKAEVLLLDSGYQPDPARRQSEIRDKGLSWLVLTVSVLILTGSVLAAFSVQDDGLWMLFPGILVFCLFWCWFYMDKRLDSRRIYLILAVLIVYTVVCFVLQSQITGGFYQTADFVMNRINQRYGGNMQLFQVSGSYEIPVFFLTVLFPVTGVLGAGSVQKKNWLLVLSVLFPVAALMLLSGGRPGNLWMYLLTLCVLLLFTAGRSQLPGWKAAMTAILLAVIVSIPAYGIAVPLAKKEIPTITRTTTRIQNRMLQSLGRILPAISSGNLKLSVEGVAGGVENGELGATDGVFFTGMDALRVTSQQMPQETVYLKGYIGETYTGSSFEPGVEENFRNAAATWKTEDDSSRYVQNLPFLRMMYYENQSTDEQNTESLCSTANQITVENINANTNYTYVPYEAFLNDGYIVDAGDGSVEGQSRQDDIFSCYWRSSYKEAMESFRDGKDTSGTLNETERAYRDYCSVYDMQIPEKGLEKLKKECAEAAEQNGWNESEMNAEMPDWAVADRYEEIRQYVVKRLLSTCSYETDVEKLKDGQDFVENFLYETKEGYSMHFAAAATMMFRIFGVPARYVTGYVAPQELFTEDADGMYSAVLEDDNAHTWVEIYQPFLGWTPVEVTPGMETEFVDQTEAKDQNAEVPDEQANGAEKVKEREEGLVVQIAGWFTGNIALFLKIAGILCGCLVLAGTFVKICAVRRERYGIGEDPAGQIRAVYRDLCRNLYRKGMPEDCIVADGSVVEQICKICPEVTAQDGELLCCLVLNANYGNDPVTEEESRWMRRICKQIKKAARRKKS
ncbi:transglutaminase domain-containing protein [Blautia sp. MSJ-19]|uniref:transglutaminase domain-containing protein n=1 Tax=Blautia sp. MSJ-19 TaxID=2841517 RepID=UPI001C0EAE7D|nr:transglutaminase domain-containing protein [Blautia sp. MSJ-19]MBU5482290.1 hypothetical protein [Blautia sp. MSJ-19]